MRWKLFLLLEMTKKSLKVFWAIRAGERNNFEWNLHQHFASNCADEIRPNCEVKFAKSMCHSPNEASYLVHSKKLGKNVGKIDPWWKRQKS